MSELAALLRRRIAKEGPLPFAEFMAEALGNPEHGYYMTADPFGAAGDFVTAPEISQMFGELIGAWCASVWEQMGRPHPVSLVELGPGRGTLMADALRALRARPEFLSALTSRLVETSPVLTGLQRRALTGTRASWHARFEDLPGGAKIVVANEFFDALPVHQFVRTEAGWRERLVALDPETRDFRLTLAECATKATALIPETVRDAPVGSVAEVGVRGLKLVRRIARSIAASRGAALIVDYGPARSAPGDSVQAVRRHEPTDPFADPGSADLTAHVDFEALAHAARTAGARAYGPIPQGTFLRRLGIEARAEALVRRAAPRQRKEIASAYRRLIEPAQMGTLFKVLALVAPKQPMPAGFEEGPP